jgi:Protein of unknown function (DUF3500)
MHPRSKEVAQVMAEAASDWLASLPPELRAKANPAFSDPKREVWFYTPTDHDGVAMADLTVRQVQLAHRMLASGLSRPGYHRATLIMNLEAWQDAGAGWRVPRGSIRGVMHGQDPAMYFASVFGEPGSPLWGWRFGGHHVSVHYTIADGEVVSSTPTFFGANPHEAPLSDFQTLRPVAGEEDIARELLHSLDANQRLVAVISKAAPFDIVQSNRPQVVDGAVPHWITMVFNGRPGEPTESNLNRMQDDLETRQAMTDADREAARYSLVPKGLPVAQLSQAQRVTFEALLREYTGRLPEPIAAAEHARLMAVLPELHFAWAGGLERKQPHYYRIQGPRVLIEYDCVQNNANHSHTVWRDPDGDFGRDLLAEHYAAAH